MASVVISSPRIQLLDENGAPIAGAKLYTYLTGTATEAETYTSSSLLVAHSNPIISDSNGFFPAVYPDPDLGALKFRFFDDEDNNLGIDTDPAWTPNAAPSRADIGAALHPLTDAEDALDITPADYGYEAMPIIDVRRHGFAEDRTEAQNAASIAEAVSVLEELSSAGGIIQLPPGQFNCDPFLIPGRIWVRGAGQQATWLTNGDATTFITIGSASNTGVLKYGCGLSDLSVYCEHRNGSAILVRETAAARLSSIYAENNGRTDGTDTGVCMTIDGGTASSFFNVFERVLANHWHTCYRISSSGSINATQQVFLMCSAFGDVSVDTTSTGLECLASPNGGNGQESIWFGGNIESCARGLILNAGMMTFVGLRTEANTNDVVFGALCNSQTFLGCLLDSSKIQDNSGAGFERHIFFACHKADGSRYPSDVPGTTQFRAAAGATETPVTVKGYASQTGDLQKFINSAGTLLSAVAANGSLKSLPGISGTTTAANNLRGTVTFSAATTAAVSFGTAEPNTSYHIVLGPQANKTFWVTAKTVNGFTLNASSSSSDTVDWMLIR